MYVYMYRLRTVSYEEARQTEQKARSPHLKPTTTASKLLCVCFMEYDYGSGCEEIRRNVYM